VNSSAGLVAALAILSAAGAQAQPFPTAPTPEAMPLQPPPADAAPPPPPTVNTAPPAAGVEVQALQTLDLFSGGARDTGLPMDLWKGSSAAVARDLIPQLGAKPMSPAARNLAKRLLATAATAPDGAGADQDLAAARALALLTLGDTRAANAAIERLTNVGSNGALSQAAAETDLTLGRDEQACKVADALSVDRGTPYWLKLRAYCQAIGGQTEAATVTLTLATAGAKEPAYARMMGSLLAGTPDPGPASLRTGLEYALSRRLNLDLAGARATANPAIAAELSADGAAPLADADITVSLANLRKARTLEAFTAAAKTAAPVIAAQAGAGAPTPDGVLLARASLAAGDLKTAQAVRASIAEAPAVDLALLDAALAAAAGRTDAQTFDRLVERGAAGSAPAQSGALILGALGGSLSAEARAELAKFNTPRGAALPGRVMALDLAAQAGAKGETGLLALSILDAAPSPADRSRAVRALAQAGLTDDARALAEEGLIALGLPAGSTASAR
jgi:hypothetical protein